MVRRFRGDGLGVSHLELAPVGTSDVPRTMGTGPTHINP